MILGEKRTASVRTKSYCDIFVVRKDDFMRLKDEYPELKEALQQMSLEKTREIAALLMQDVIL